MLKKLQKDNKQFNTEVNTTYTETESIIWKNNSKTKVKVRRVNIYIIMKKSKEF